MYTKTKIYFAAFFAAFFILLQPVSTGEFRPSHDTRMIRSELAYEAALERSETAHNARLEAAARTQHQPKKRASRSLTRANPGGLNWGALRNCENHGLYTGFGGGGRYFAAYQVDKTTWASNGGDPSHWGSASPAEQDAVAYTIYSHRGSEPWPKCGYLLFT